MEEALDRGYLTARKQNTRYVKAVLGNQAFWWLKDTGANFTVVTTKLCKYLGLKVLPYDGTYALPSGAREKCAGKLGREMLQLHDKLLLEIDNI